MTDVKQIRIKNIGKLEGTINGLLCTKYCEVLLNKNQFKEAEIKAKLVDFLFAFRFDVVGFKIKKPLVSIEIKLPKIYLINLKTTYILVIQYKFLI